MSRFKKIREKMESWMNAVAFAEANEQDKAIEFVGAVEVAGKRKWSLDNVLAAATFAEANAHDIAREFLGVGDVPERGVLNIPGIKVWIGTVLEPEPFTIPGVKVWCGSVAMNGN